MDFDRLFKFFFIINKRARIINILIGYFKWITDLRKFYSIIYTSRSNIWETWYFIKIEFQY